MRRLGLAAHEAQRVLLEVDVVADREGALELRLRCRLALRVVQARQVGSRALQEDVLHLPDVWYCLAVAAIHVELCHCRGTGVSAARGDPALLLLLRSSRRPVCRSGRPAARGVGAPACAGALSHEGLQVALSEGETLIDGDPAVSNSGEWCKF